MFVLSLVAADYFTLFGSKTRVELAFTEARFKTTDKNNGNLIFNVGVRCFQKGNHNACTLRDSHQAGVVSVHFPYKRIIESSLLFTKNEKIEKAANPNVNIMFIHNDYYTITKKILLDDLFEDSGNEYRVEMIAIGSDAIEESS